MKTIGLVFGGVSPESDISIITTCAVYKYLKQLHDYTIIPLYIDKTGEWYYVPQFDGTVANFVKHKASPGAPVAANLGCGKGLQLNIKGKWPKASKSVFVDILFPILHGVGGEDGSIQGLGQLAGIPVVGPDIFTAARTIDKVKTKSILKLYGFPVCDYHVVEKVNYNKEHSSIISALGTTLIVKPYNGGSSIGVVKCINEQELSEGIELGFTFGDKVIVEPFLGGWKELCCSVTSLNGIVTASLIEDPGTSSEVFSFDDKYKVGSGAFTGSARTSHIPAELDPVITEKIRSMCIDMYNKLGLTGTPRIDWLVNEETGECVIIEINAIPGNLAMHIWSASGVVPRNLLQSLISQAHTDIQLSYKAGQEYTTSILEDYAKLGGSKLGK